MSAVVAAPLSAIAQPVSFDPFTVTTPNDSGANTLQTLLLPSGVTQSGVQYTTFSIEFDWTPDAFANARQWNAIWALTDRDPAPGGAVFYADPGPSLFAKIALVPQFEPGTLSWVGVLDPEVAGGADLYFSWLQFNAFTGTTWSDIRLTLDSPAIVETLFDGDTSGAPTWTRFRDTREGSGDVPSNVQNIRYDALPFYVETDGIYQFTTRTDFGVGNRWNGVIAIYENDFDPSLPDANRIGLWVGTAPGVINFADRMIAFELEAGVQYYFLQTGRRSSDAGPYTGTVQGVGGVTFGTIPDCVADLNGDGVVDADDFFLFLSLFADGDPRADINGDGVIDADDFFAYLALFAQGC